MDKDNVITLNECKVPLCKNIQDVVQNWPICTDCMENTIKRFMWIGATRESAMRAILRDIDELCRMEQKSIDKYGAHYDRDAENPPVKDTESEDE